MKLGNGFKNAFLKAFHAIKRDKAVKSKSEHSYKPLQLYVKYHAQTVYANRKRNKIQRNPVHYATVSTSMARHLVKTGQAVIITPSQYYKHLHLNKTNIPVPCHLN